MSQIILDMGSGNTCKNDKAIVKKMIDTVVAMDSKKHPIVFKWQLETVAPKGQKTLDPDVFRFAYEYAAEAGYMTTSSVFDAESLAFLLGFKVPFIKIACQPQLYQLTSVIPRGIAVLASIDQRDNIGYDIWAPFTRMCCIPEYPAKLSDYHGGEIAYSDHTPGLELWNYYHPAIWEKHFVLEREDSNPDSGVFALTPDQLKEVIG